MPEASQALHDALTAASRGMKDLPLLIQATAQSNFIAGMQDHGTFTSLVVYYAGLERQPACGFRVDVGIA